MDTKIKEDLTMSWEILTPAEEEFERRQRRKSAVKMGYEVEQNPNRISYELRRRLTSLGKELTKDGSGPIEWTYGATVNPSEILKEFLNDVGNLDWVWQSRYQDPYDDPDRVRGCGCHLHFSPSPSYTRNASREDKILYWTILYNTLVDTCTLLIPMFVWEDKSRDEAWRWAKVRTKRISPLDCKNTYYIPYVERRKSGLHPHDFVCFNRKKTKKPLTIEVRLNETHPAIGCTALEILSRIVKGCFDRRDSVKVEDRSVIENIQKDVVGLYPDSPKKSPYTALKTSGRVVFESGRTIPLLPDDVLVYNSAWDVFKAVMEKIIEQEPVSSFTRRVTELWIREGIPNNNERVCWKILEREFSWINPQIVLTTEESVPPIPPTQVPFPPTRIPVPVPVPTGNYQALNVVIYANFTSVSKRITSYGNVQDCCRRHGFVIFRQPRGWRAQYESLRTTPLFTVLNVGKLYDLDTDESIINEDLVSFTRCLYTQTPYLVHEAKIYETEVQANGLIMFGGWEYTILGEDELPW